MAGAAPIVDDLRAESDALDELVADLPAQRWTTATPAAGWTIAHQIAHLLWTDRVALIAVDEAHCISEWGHVAEGRKLPWFGPPMSAASMATARLMETWAHGLDVADALGVTRAPTARLRSIAHIGVRTRDFAFAVHGLTPPAAPFHVKLSAPAGAPDDVWTWGPEDAEQRVTGSAEHFCMLVTQRRPRAALDVRAEGPDAEQWLGIAQAFAGPPGAGRG